MNVCILGGNGRIGKYVNELLTDYYNEKINLIIVDSDTVYKDVYDVLDKNTLDIVVDFSGSVKVVNQLASCLRMSIKVISGSSSFSIEDINYLKMISKNYNTSFVHVVNFQPLSAIVHNFIVSHFDESAIDINESHYHTKVDCPSGTINDLLSELDSDQVKFSSHRGFIKEPIHKYSIEFGSEVLKIETKIQSKENFDKYFIRTMNLLIDRSYFLVVNLRGYYNLVIK